VIIKVRGSHASFEIEENSREYYRIQITEFEMGNRQVHGC